MCGSEIRAKVLARVSLLRFPLSELHNQPLLLLLLDLLSNDWVPDSDLGFHLPTNHSQDSNDNALSDTKTDIDLAFLVNGRTLPNYKIISPGNTCYQSNIQIK